MSITWRNHVLVVSLSSLGEILAESESKMEESKGWMWKEEQIPDHIGYCFYDCYCCCSYCEYMGRSSI